MAKSASNKGKRDVSAIMRRVRSANTSPEVALRHALESAGFHLSDIGGNDLPGKPDIVLTEEHIAIFVDGDFWHGGQWRKRKFASIEDQFREAPSKDYWINKIRRNVNRDFINTKKLLDEGWKVIRFWESHIKKDLTGCVSNVIQASKKRLKADICSIVPGRTFVEFCDGGKSVRTGLENRGWTGLRIAEKGCTSIPSVTLATAALSRNDISLSGGNKESHGKKTARFVSFISAIEDMKKRRPPILLLESPATILSYHKGEDFRLALLELNNLGYTVDAFTLDAAGQGAKIRRRLFITAILEFCIPADEIRESACVYAGAVRPETLSEFICGHPEIDWNVRSLPAPPDYGGAAFDGDKHSSLVEWIAEYYLNPLVNELMKGRTLAPYFV